MVTLIRIMCISTFVSLLDHPGSRVLLKLKTGQEEGARHGEVEGAVCSSDEGNILRLPKAVKLGLEKLWLENGNFSCVLWIQSFRADWIHLVFCFAFTSTVNILMAEAASWLLPVSVRPWKHYLWISSLWLPGGNTLSPSEPYSSAMCPSFSLFPSLSLFLPSKMKKIHLTTFYF